MTKVSVGVSGYVSRCTKEEDDERNRNAAKQIQRRVPNGTSLKDRIERDRARDVPGSLG